VGELILYFANMYFFLQFFEINEVSNAEWVAQKLAFVQQPDSSSSLPQVAESLEKS
jgi:hypothetical protein